MKRIVKKLRNLCLWALLGLFLTWLVSCGTGKTPGLEMWTMQLQPQFTSYFTKLNSTFEAKNPGVKVIWQDIPWDAMERKILTAILANTAPDVVNLNPNFASQLASRNTWLDLNTKLSPEEKARYLPQIWQANTLNKVTFGVPWYLTTRITIYNQDLLKQAGINQPPATYTELAEFAQKIKEKTGKYALFVTFVPTDSGEILESFIQMGVSLVNAQGKAAFNTPKGIKAFQYWVDLYQKGFLPEEVLTQGHRHAIELYQGGEIAILSSSAESLKNIETNAPTIAKISASAPQITGETGKKNVAVMNLVIPKNTDKPDEAVKLALFITNTENQLSFAKAANVLPSTVAGVKTYIQELEQEKEQTPLSQARKVSAKQLADAEILVPAMKNLNQLQKVIYENLQSAMLKEKTVKQAVKDAADAWDSLT